MEHMFWKCLCLIFNWTLVHILTCNFTNRTFFNLAVLCSQSLQLLADDIYSQKNRADWLSPVVFLLCILVSTITTVSISNLQPYWNTNSCPTKCLHYRNYIKKLTANNEHTEMLVQRYSIAEICKCKGVFLVNFIQVCADF